MWRQFKFDNLIWRQVEVEGFNNGNDHIPLRNVTVRKC